MRLKCIKDGNFVEIKFRYDKGGFSYWTYKENPRCYYLSISPIKIAKQTYGDTEWETIQTVLGDGCKLQAQEVSRKSPKAEREAVAYFKENLSLIRDAIRYAINTAKNDDYTLEGGLLELITEDSVEELCKICD